jgi:hypothetical protein
MTLQLLHSKFPYTLYEENLIFFCISVEKGKTEVRFSKKSAGDGIRGERSQLNKLIQLEGNSADKNQETQR